MRKTRLGCTILEGSDIADLPLVSENANILDNALLGLEESFKTIGTKDIKLEDGRTLSVALRDIDLNSGKKTDLTTTDKTNIVSAINELKTELGSIDSSNEIRYTGSVSGINDKIIPRFSKNRIERLVAGLAISFKNNAENTGPVTFNVSDIAGAGPKPILKSNGQPLSSGALKKDSIYTIRYNGVNFILQGEGGEYGTALVGDVAKGKTIGTEEGVKTGTLELTGSALPARVLVGDTFYSKDLKKKENGTMPNNGYLSKTISTQGGKVNFSQGYYTAGEITANFANLVGSNVRKGVNIGGVVGSLEEGKKFASGTTDTIAEFLEFTLSNGKKDKFHYINVDGLNFKPSVIIITAGIYTTIYNSYLESNLRISLDSDRDNQIYIKIVKETSPAVVSSRGFTLPVDGSSWATKSWFAYE